MLLFRRSFAMPSIGAYYTLVDHAHSAFRVRIEHGRGVACDEAMMFPAVAWSGYGDRPRLDVVLRGRVRDVENGVVRWLTPGDYAIGRALDSLYMRIEGDEVLLLSIEYNLGSLGTSAPIGLPTGALASAAVADITADAEELLRVGRGPNQDAIVAGAIGRLFARLRAEGVPFDAWRARDLVVPVAPALQRVADALGSSLSNIGGAPGTRDLEQALGVSRRRVSQLVGELASRYGMNGMDWRTMRDRWRVGSSLLAMSNPRARTEDVAAAVGYQSANAFCHAYRQANLPSPGSVRTELARLL
ncbi:MAG: helix-turn-helix transcriptional regulator [Labilithrix sp.]|nr:helix-turn-helix transcriptional regulator [Labilithrix sp.]MCW5816765.1 helix-turn-helix transcriptional regulator [Labilithrix sp.]